MATDYTTVAESRSWVGVGDTLDDGLLAGLVTVASRMIDRYCGRHFGKDTVATARQFSASTYDTLVVDDFWTTSGLLIAGDPAGNGTWSDVWTTTDYVVSPVTPTDASGQSRPYSAIQTTIPGGFRFPVNGRALVRVTAQWGWPAVPSEVALAAKMLVAVMAKRRDMPTGSGGFGGLFSSVFQDDPMIGELLAPYRRALVAIGGC